VEEGDGVERRCLVVAATRSRPEICSEVVGPANTVEGEMALRLRTFSITPQQNVYKYIYIHIKMKLGEKKGRIGSATC
jgi:hypothetical protein